jgi:hypothetical protein
VALVPANEYWAFTCAVSRARQFSTVPYKMLMNASPQRLNVSHMLLASTAAPSSTVLGVVPPLLLPPDPPDTPDPPEHAAATSAKTQPPTHLKSMEPRKVFECNRRDGA